MKKSNKFAAAVLLVAGAVLVMSTTLNIQKQGDPWLVPGNYKNMKNPNVANAESIKMGQMLYMKNCSSCHGKTGKGDGVKARTLETFPGDFSLVDFKNQTDGEKFYKSKFGRDEMPKFEGKIPDEDIWNMVNFMNSLAK